VESEASHETRQATHNAAERAAIRAQLERMLASPLFTHSRRYPILLRHVVERTLEGCTEGLKERTLGIDVFGRDPGYDTNADPIVRATACEIRKRIAQYYHEDEHRDEIRIDLSPGSYVPEFRLTAKQLEPALVPAAATAVPSLRRRFWYWALLAASVILVLAAAGLALWRSPTPVDQFWRPVLNSPNPALLCIGQRPFLGSSPESPSEPAPDIARFAGARGRRDGPITLFELYYLGSQNVALSDAVTVGKFVGLMQSKSKAYQIRGQSSTTLADLRSGPVVLVGAFNNDWTMRLTGPLRFSFERDNDVFGIRDRQKPSQRQRCVKYSISYLNLTEDFALISRVFDPTTERMVVVAAGLTGYGTMAAGEFLTDATHLQTLVNGAPKDWDHKNLQMVIATTVIKGNYGPPRVVERHFW
jgi:hypothetical protein